MRNGVCGRRRITDEERLNRILEKSRRAYVRSFESEHRKSIIKEEHTNWYFIQASDY